jgi:hypothetical protein
MITTVALALVAYLAVSFPLAVVLGRRLREQSPCCTPRELPPGLMVPVRQADPASPGQR